MAIAPEIIIQKLIDTERFTNKKFGLSPIFEDDRVIIIGSNNPDKGSILRIDTGLSEHSEAASESIMQNIDTLKFAIKKSGKITSYISVIHSKGKPEFSEDVLWLDTIYCQNSRQLAALLHSLKTACIRNRWPTLFVYSCEHADTLALDYFKEVGARIKTKSYQYFHIDLRLDETCFEHSLSGDEEVSMLEVTEETMAELESLPEKPEVAEKYRQLFIIDKEEYELVRSGLTDHKEAEECSRSPEESSAEIKLARLRSNPHECIKGGLLFQINELNEVKSLHISVLWISPEAGYRGRGYSKVLVRLAENYAKSQGCHVSELETTEYQAPWLYPKLGYVPQDVPNRCLGGFPIHYMFKPLETKKTTRSGAFAKETIAELKRSPLYGYFR